MHKVLVISAHRLNRSPSQRYRYEQYLDYLKQHGFEFTFSPLLNEKDDALFYSKGHFLSKVRILFNSMIKRRMDLMRAAKFDIVFIQREASFLATTRFEQKAAKKTKVIFDFDDSIWLLDTSPGNKKYEALKNPNKIKQTITGAHLVIAGNSYLALFARRFNKNVVIIPTTVDTEVHIPKPELRGKEKVIIGWSGSISTIKHFELVVPALKKLKEKYGGKIGFKVIGDSSYKNTELDINGQAWSAEREVDELNTLDIGIMPLENDEWAKGKCGLKGLTYMACEVPAVMSSIGVNTEIIVHGENGYLVSNENDWINHLSLLIENAELRKKIGKKGRETVIKHYSKEANKEKYLEAFKRVAG